MALIQARMLRLRGSTLPLRIFHDGHAGTLDDPLTELVDVRTLWGDRRRQGAWETKSWAILNSGFRRCLWLDADAYPVSDPRPAFELLLTAPFVFWNDLHRDPSLINWYALGIPEGGAPVQSGHMLFDVAGAAKLLETVDWLGQRSDYYYQHVGYGDQDAFIVGLAAGTSPWRMLTDVTAHRFAYVIGREDCPLFVHRFRKIYNDEMPRWDMVLPGERDVQAIFHEIVPGYRRLLKKPCGKRKNVQITKI